MSRSSDELSPIAARAPIRLTSPTISWPRNAKHAPRKLRLESLCGLVFGTLSAHAAPLEQYLGPDILSRIRRVMRAPVQLLGDYSQTLPSNWKLYMENVKDTYHASLLHTFFTTFRLNRLSQKGGIVVSESGGHHVSYSFAADSGGKAERVTAFKSGDVRFPSISADGKVIVFEHDFGIWKLDTSSKKVTPIHLNIEAETQENGSEMRAFNSEADDYDLAPSARRIVVSTHGEIFTVATEEGDIKQITESSARDRNVSYSPDGKSLASISDRSGREELYVTTVDGLGEPQKLTDIDALKKET